VSCIQEFGIVGSSGPIYRYLGFGVGRRRRELQLINSNRAHRLILNLKLADVTYVCFTARQSYCAVWNTHNTLYK